MTHEAQVYHRLARQVEREAERQPPTYHIHPHARIVKVLLWAAAHDRPISWACVPANWPRRLRPRPLPSQPCMSRRLRTVGVLGLLERLQVRMRGRLPRGLLKLIDAKPLPVGGCTKDRDAAYGRAAGCKAKGYKLFTIVDHACGAWDQWQLGAMNHPEERMAEKLLANSPGPALYVGDGIYDINRLYRLAGERGGALVARPPKGDGVGRRRQTPERLEGLATARSQTGEALLTARVGIERSYGNATSFGGGLGPLPAWVRRPHRVAVWVAAKAVINMDRQYQLLISQKDNAAAA